MTNDCCLHSEEYYHPPLWLVLQIPSSSPGAPGYEDQLRETLQDVDTANAFLWKYSEKRMRVHASLEDYKDTVMNPSWQLFLNRVEEIVQSPFGYNFMLGREADISGDLSNWRSGKREVTSKSFPAPGGNPNTAYVEDMSQQTETTAEHMSPDDLESAQNMQQPMDAFIDRFGVLFLEVF